MLEKFISCIWSNKNRKIPPVECKAVATSPELTIRVVVKCCMQINLRSILPFPDKPFGDGVFVVEA
jgi:hypothetical protein